MNFPDQNIGVGSRSLLQIFPAQASNPGLLRCRGILYQLSHKGSLFIGYTPVKKQKVFLKSISFINILFLRPYSQLRRLFHHLFPPTNHLIFLVYFCSLSQVCLILLIIFGLPLPFYCSTVLIELAAFCHFLCFILHTAVIYGLETDSMSLLSSKPLMTSCCICNLSHHGS